jgi:hypothetical protein
MNDEREGCPSASGMDRDKRCPGSWRHLQAHPRRQEPDAMRDEGTLIHAVLAGEKPEGVTGELSQRAQQTVEMCQEIEAQILRDLGFDGPPVMVEKRLWVGQNFPWSGKADKIYAHEERGLIIDYKTGPDGAEDADSNMQMRALAVLVDMHIPQGVELLKSVTVALIHPWCSPQKSIAVYDSEALMNAHEECSGIIKRAYQPNAPRIPSPEACKWCNPAACPEANALMPAGSLSVATMSPELLGQLLDRRKIIKDIITEAEKRAKELIKAGVEVPGWTLAEGKTQAPITDADTVFARMIELGGDSGDFIDACTVGKGKLEGVLKRMTGEKGKALAAVMDRVLDGCTEEKVGEKILKKV